MQDTALEIGRAFLSIYGAPNMAILDVGSQDLNGSLRTCAPPGATYVGVDVTPGPGVDVTLGDPHKLPFQDGRFDLIVSTSCLEHDPMFWLTFLEMARVTKPGGYIYINVPSNGQYHRFPTDNWRFYPDAGLGLQTWANREGLGVTLIESFVARRDNDSWNDTVLVFARGVARPVRNFLCNIIPNPMNLRKPAELDEVLNQSSITEDQQIISRLSTALRTANSRIADLEHTMQQYEAAMKALATMREQISELTVSRSKVPNLLNAFHQWVAWMMPQRSEMPK
jgi:SAM-dependent methyltransferase